MKDALTRVSTKKSLNYAPVDSSHMMSAPFMLKKKNVYKIVQEVNTDVMKTMTSEHPLDFVNHVRAKSVLNKRLLFFIRQISFDHT